LLVWTPTTTLWDATLIMAARDISKKRKFVADGVFYSELNEVNRNDALLKCVQTSNITNIPLSSYVVVLQAAV